MNAFLFLLQFSFSLSADAYYWGEIGGRGEAAQKKDLRTDTILPDRRKKNKSESRERSILRGKRSKYKDFFKKMHESPNGLYAGKKILGGGHHGNME